MALATYDVVFNDAENSNNKGFQYSKKEAKEYIRIGNGSNHSYFKDYKGGTVSIMNNMTGKIVKTYPVF